MKYRSRIDIISVILDAANGGTDGLTKTKIMYQAYLSHEQIKEYLSVLIESELLNYDVHLNQLREEAVQKRISLNTLANQIIDSYVNYSSNLSKARLQ